MTKFAFLLMAVALPLVAGCGSYYKTINQTPPSTELRNYQVVNVGWLDLGPQKYKEYGFDEKDKGKWLALVNDMNLKSMPQYLKEHMPTKAVSVVQSPTQLPAPDGLVVVFANVDYKQQTSSGAQIMFGSMAGSDTMDVNVRFFDGRAGRELYATTISVDTAAGSGYGSMSFDGRVNNAVYNLARFIAEKTQ